MVTKDLDAPVKIAIKNFSTNLYSNKIKYHSFTVAQLVEHQDHINVIKIN